ncbi:hypothetical protein AALP_AA7G028400 [Arabis alpina]|uniref:Cytochrome p450 n=1 Tax=Arabis alpina TaxID=50452 RepID=A0A087GFK6_ARAAL|nr:hypothetical protein AALP_AA7G028400 [Arabis alpina]
MILISLCLTTFLAFFLNALFKRINNTKPKLPSPWRLPVIGNLHQLSLNPHRALHALSLRYGPLMVLHFGSAPVLVVTSRDVTHEIMKTYDLKFANRQKSKAIDIFMDGGRDIIFSSCGEDWKNKKSLCVVHLLNNKMVRSFESLREGEIKLMTDKLEAACSASSSVNLSNVIMALTNDVICRITFGRKYNSKEGGIDVKKLVMTSSEFFGKFFFGDFIPSLAWIDRLRGIDDQMKDLNNKLEGFLDNTVQEHVDADHEEPSDFVDVLLWLQKDKTKKFQFDKNDIKLILKDIFFAGTATTASLLEWTLTELFRHPKVMKKLQDEIKKISTHNSNVTEKEVEQITYLHDVIKEGLRLHPSGPLLFRLPSENVQLKGYEIAAGTQVIINVWAIQRDPAIWGLDADEFRPERHLEANLDFNGTDSKFLPFGAGRRLCPGIGFAMVMAKLILANVVKRFNYRVEVGPTGDDMPDLVEASGIDVCRKFPLIVFPSLAQA